MRGVSTNLSLKNIVIFTEIVSYFIGKKLQIVSSALVDLVA